MNNFKSIRFVLYYTMALNIVVTIVKLVVGYATGSLSLVADGYDSLFDGASNVVGLVGIYIASRPPDASHPYGHRKYETLSAVTISILLFVTTVELAQSAIHRLANPVVPAVNVWTFVALLISIAAHIYVSAYERRRGLELKSEVLMADAMHTRADVLVSLSVLVGMIVVRMGYPIVDAILALFIAVVIGKIGVDIIRQSTGVLVDAVAVDEDRVKQIVSDIPGVLTFHQIRSRGQEDNAYLDLHVRVPQGIPVEQAHHIAHQVQRQLLSGIAGLRDVIVHVEPQEVEVTGTDLAGRIREVAARLPATAVHAIQALEVQNSLYVTLHLEVGPALSVERAHQLASQLEDMLRTEIPAIAAVDVHLEPVEANGQATLVDEPTARSIRAILEQATRESTELCECHEVVVSRQGASLHVTVHWHCDPQLSIEAAHELTSELERRVRERLPELGQFVVHVEPRES